MYIYIYIYTPSGHCKYLPTTKPVEHVGISNTFSTNSSSMGGPGTSDAMSILMFIAIYMHNSIKQLLHSLAQEGNGNVIVLIWYSNGGD